MEDVELLPSEIYFPQDSIRNKFSDAGKYTGMQIGIVLDQIINGGINLQQFINGITVAQTTLKNGNEQVIRWASRNNRSLWVIKELEGLGRINQRQHFQIGEIPENMKTTKNGGERVIVRNGLVGGNEAKPFPFWSYFANLEHVNQIDFLRNFTLARIQNGYFQEDLTAGKDIEDMQEFDVIRKWYDETTQADCFKGTQFRSIQPTI